MFDLKRKRAMFDRDSYNDVYTEIVKKVFSKTFEILATCVKIDLAYETMTYLNKEN